MTQREAFEVWAKTRGYPLHDIVPKHGPTSSMPQTVDRFMEVAYEAWQAAQAQPSQARELPKHPVALSRDDTEHGVYYYKASEVDSIIVAINAKEQTK